MIRHWLTMLSVLLCTSGGAFAQSPGEPAASWPSRAVRAIVPIAAGSGIDIVARTVSQQLAKQLGRPFVVENRPGGATTTGAAAVAGAASDGYTILFHSVALTVTPSTMANLPYDMARDLAGGDRQGRGNQAQLRRPRAADHGLARAAIEHSAILVPGGGKCSWVERHYPARCAGSGWSPDFRWNQSSSAALIPPTRREGLRDELSED